LEELLKYHNPKLVIQTRSPLVTRDIDLLSQFKHVQVNMTVTTDDEAVRKVFEPLCPSNEARLNAIRKVREGGINACVTMTPLLPVVDPHRLSRSLLETGVSHFVVQPFHASKGKFVAGTREQAINLIQALGWDAARYHQTVEVIKSYIPQLREGKEGFIPLWKQETSQAGSNLSETP
jgi:DNA repair photolyase